MPGDDQLNPWRFVGSGFELAVAAALFGAIGYWIDTQAGTKPWGLVIGATLGIVGGLYNFITAALKANK